MADDKNFFRPMEVFWTRDESDDDDILRCRTKKNVKTTPEKLGDVGNRRPLKNRVKGKKTQEVKAAMPRKQPLVQDVTPQKIPPTSATDLLELNGNGPSSGRSSKVSLKDLCTDDKKRVANLIKELARLGEEKESMNVQLNSERQLFEKQMDNLTKQQDKILTEREDIQKQLSECQVLLSRYQHHLLDNQDRISDGSAQNTPKRQVPHSQAGVEMYTPRPAKVNNRTPSQSMLANHSEQSRSAARTPERNASQQSNHKYIPNGHQTANNQLGGSTSSSQNNKLTNNSPYRCPPNSGKYTLHADDANNSFTDRPFTNKIDQIIAQEKKSSEDENVPLVEITVKPGLPKPVIPEERLVGIGPLNPPILSSTQRSEYSEFGTVQDLTQREFHPLKPSPSSTRDSSPGSLIITKPPDGNNNKVAFTSPLETAKYSPPYDEERFKEYYKTLAPEQRKQELTAQKEALLGEQKRLKIILQEQETMLQVKQDQLHKQQQIQQDRLRYFEQMGTFPPFHVYSNRQIDPRLPQLPSGDNMAQMDPAFENIQPTPYNLQNLLHQQPSSYPVYVEPRYGPSLPLHQKQTYPHNSEPIEKHNGVVYLDPDADPYAIQHSRPVPVLPGGRDKSDDAVLQTAVQVPVKETRSASTSPLRVNNPPLYVTGNTAPPVPVEQPYKQGPHTRRQQGSWPDDNILIEPEEYQTDRQPAKTRYVKTSELLDLVNEVESEIASALSSQENSFTIQSPHQFQPLHPTKSQPGNPYSTDDDTGSYVEELNHQKPRDSHFTHQRGHDSHFTHQGAHNSHFTHQGKKDSQFTHQTKEFTQQETSLEDEDAEESQVLEEVFFVL